jgi:hypothetical protein
MQTCNFGICWPNSAHRGEAEHCRMGGQVDPQAKMFSYFSPESRVPADHPLRDIKAHADLVRKELSVEIDALYVSFNKPMHSRQQTDSALQLTAAYRPACGGRSSCSQATQHASL